MDIMDWSYGFRRSHLINKARHTLKFYFKNYPKKERLRGVSRKGGRQLCVSREEETIATGVITTGRKVNKNLHRILMTLVKLTKPSAKG